MKNKLVKNGLGFLMGLFLLFVIFFTSIEIIAFNMPYYRWHYNNYNISQDTGIEYDDLIVITRNMLSFLKGHRDNLDMQVSVDGVTQEVFGIREKQHMDDVQELFVKGYIIRNVSFFAFIILLILSWRLFRSWLVILLKWIQYVFFGFGAVAILMAIIISTNFNYYFTIFHEIFFKNDLWLLDPETEILINLVPLSFFINTAALIIVTFLILSAISLLGIQRLKKILST